MLKKCKLCGKLFESKTTKQICERDHFQNCEFCGKQFILDPKYLNRVFCSDECSIKSANEKRSKAREEKKHLDINKRKGGRYTKVCSVCGEEFHTSSKTRELCYKPHTRKCCICGEDFPLNVYSSKTLTCSSKCASELRTRRNLEKYGVRSTLELPEVKEKIAQTCMERYGTENPMSSEIVQSRIKKTNLERYGYERALDSPEIKEKSRQTCMERYGVPYGCMSDQAKEKTVQTNLDRRGVEHVFQDPEFQKNARKSCLERYGTEHYTQSDDFKSKAQATWIENYGVDNPLKSQEIQRRAEDTSLKLYGTRRPQQNEEIKSRIRQTNIMNHANSIQDDDAREQYLEFKRDPKSYVENALKKKWTPTTISHMIGSSDSTLVLNMIHKYSLEELTKFCKSQMEQDIELFIESIRSDLVYNVDILSCDRKAIGGKELDIYLPNQKFAIECNPTITHNSTNTLEMQYDSSKSPMDKNYHLNKSVLCENKGIFLLHIFGYEWSNHKSVLKSMIRNILNANTAKYYARNLEIREVSHEDSRIFLENNHRQGFASAKIRLGLYDSNELVSLMTFSNMRSSIGNKYDDTIFTYELSRFCNRLNTSVIGGASKLFRYFIRNYNFDRIVSFSDRAHTRGNLYEVLGFKKINISDPNYVWVNSTTDLYFNRISCQKHRLRELFNDDSIDIVNKTEEQIMSERGFVKVYDSGNIRWEYIK